MGMSVRGSDSWIIEIVLRKGSQGESFEGHLTCEGGAGVHPQCIGPAQESQNGVSCDLHPATQHRPVHIRCIALTPQPELYQDAPHLRHLGQSSRELPGDIQSRQVSAAAETRGKSKVGPKPYNGRRKRTGEEPQLNSPLCYLFRSL